MEKNLCFQDIPVGGLFVTGPADHMMIKLTDEVVKRMIGGYARFLHNGTQVWIPGCRCVNTPTKRDFKQLAERHDWEQITDLRRFEEVPA